MKASIAAVFLVFLSGVVFAQTRDCASLTHQALEISGFNQSLDQASELVNSEGVMAQFAGNGGDASRFATVFRPIARKHLDSQLMRKDVESRLAAHCNPDQMAKVIERLQSPLVARMLVLEAAANSPEERGKAQRYARAISIAPPPDNRVDVIETIDSSAGVTDVAVDTVIAITRGMMEGADVNPELAGGMEQQRRELKAQMHNAIQISLLSTYRSATVPDLSQYAKELSSEPLKSFYSQVNKAFVEMLEARSQAIGRDLKAAVTASRN